MLQLEVREANDQDTEIIVLSDVWLDRPHVVKGLKGLLSAYDESCQV